LIVTSINFSRSTLNACNIALKVIRHLCYCYKPRIRALRFSLLFLRANEGLQPPWLCYWTPHSSMSLRYEQLNYAFEKQKNGFLI